MRRMATVLCVLTLAVWIGCGDDDDGGAVDAANTTSDGSTPTIDGAVNGIDGSVAVFDAAPPVLDDAGMIVCGMSACDPDTQECCSGQGIDVCVPAGQCGGGTMECAGGGDCPAPNEVCCVSFGGPGGSGTECSNAQQCQLVVCADQNDCDQGDVCCESQLGSICTAEMFCNQMP